MKVGQQQQGMTMQEVAQGYRYLDVQNNANVTVLQGMNDIVDDHAQRLDVLWSQAIQAKESVQGVTQQMDGVTKQVVENDNELKSNVGALEAIVTEQGLAIAQLRTDVQSAVKDLATVLAQQSESSLGAPTVSSIDRAAVEAQFGSIQAHVD